MKKSIKLIVTKFLFTIIFILFILIVNKFNKNLTKEFKTNLFNKTINFVKINNLSKKVMGKDFIYNGSNEETLPASKEIYTKNKEKYHDAEKFKVSNDLPIGSIESGVVISIKDDDIYNKLIVVQGVDGFNIWYGNIKDINVGLYDYIEKNSLIGTSDGDYIYLLIEKDGKFYTYDEYSQNKN